MKQIIKKIAVDLIVLAMIAGCATAPHPVGGDKPADTENPSKVVKTMLTVGGLLLLTAIVVNEAEDNVEDAVRNAAAP